MSTRVATAATLLLVVPMVLLPAGDAISGSITIAGNGPELPVIERLVRAFERGHLGSAVEIRWDLSSHPIDILKSGNADFAVAGQTDPDLTPIPIAWDGIAVVVDFTNVTSLVIDRVEPAKQTVQDGRYKLRRLVLLLKRKQANPAADAFAAFALSTEGQTIIDEMFIPYAPPEK